MQFINIGTIGEYPEDFLIAKVDVERELIENEVIEKRMKLEEFIMYLSLQEYIYMKNQKSIAFKILKGQSDTYVFYSILENEEDLFKSFAQKLEKLKYDLSSLQKVEALDLLQMDMTNTELFLIKSEMYK